MKTVRTFIAFDVPEDVSDAIVRARGEMESGLPAARWVRAEHMHLTLLFLGDQPISVFERLFGALREGLVGISSPRISLGGTGFFPDARRGRVAWIGGEATGACGVHAGVCRAAAGAGLTVGSKPWSLHLTQARLRRPWPPSAVRLFTTWGQDLKLRPFDASEVVIFSSELNPGGPVYTSLERIQLS